MDPIFFKKHFISTDERGKFEKLIPIKDLIFETKEIFFSTSKIGTVRGMHIQRSPNPTSKVIKIIKGRVIDVLLDCRKDSSTYGEFYEFELSEDSDVLHIPKGYAHGFQALTENATMLYVTDDYYNPETDSGYRFDSFGYNWPIPEIIISERDKNLPKFSKNT